MKALAAAAIAGTALVGLAQDTSDVTAVKAADVKWADSPTMPGGVKTCLVHGDPKKGPYVVLMNVAAGTVLPPHWHSADEAAVVQSGAIVIGRGEKAEGGTEIQAGGYFTIPAKVPHWGRAKTDAILVRYGNGPADIAYCNPADDPRKK